MRVLEFEFQRHGVALAVDAVLGKFLSFTPEDAYRPSGEIYETSEVRALSAAIVNGAPKTVLAEAVRRLIAAGRENCESNYPYATGGVGEVGDDGCVILRSEGDVDVRLTPILWNRDRGVRITVDFHRDSSHLGGQLVNDLGRVAAETLTPNSSRCGRRTA